MKPTPLLRSFNKILDLKSMKMLNHFSQLNPSPLTIKQFMDFGQTATEAESFHFLRKEIPVRLSNIMKEINLLPSNLLQMPSVHILQVGVLHNQCNFLMRNVCQDWHARSFCDLMEYETMAQDDEETLARFCQALTRIQDRHACAVQTMAQGVLELRESHCVNNQTEMSIQYFLDRFYMSRISMRMLIHQVNTDFKHRVCIECFSTLFCSSLRLTRTLPG